MNIIGNTCIASYLVKYYLNERFNNPFNWALIDYKSIYNLITNYKTIDFNKIKISKGRLINECYSSVADNYITIDNKVNVFYVHYIKDDSCKVPVTRENQIYTDDPVNQIIKMYRKRLLRMKGTPIFVLGTAWHRLHITEKVVNDLIKLKSNYPIIIVTDKDINIKLPKNILYYKYEPGLSGIEVAKGVYENLFKNNKVNKLIDELNKIELNKPKLKILPSKKLIKVKTEPINKNKLTKSKLPKLPTPLIKALKIKEL